MDGFHQDKSNRNIHPPYSPARPKAILGKLALKSASGTGVVAGTLIYASLSAGSARALQIRLIVDNDWALLAGTSTSINRIIIQNNVTISDQNFTQTVSDALPGETTWWLLAMNGGREDDAFGSIGTITNFATASGLQGSNNIVQDYLFDYGNDSYLTVSRGLYNVNLADVQAALPNLTFGSPGSPPPINGMPSTGCSTVCGLFPSVSGGSSLLWQGRTAVLFNIPIPKADLAVPGPFPALGAAAAFGFSRKLRKRIKASKTLGISISAG
jgi:hypothetical protein